MKKQTAIALICATTAWAQAQEVGQVISRTAVYQQVAVPRQTCTTPSPTTPAPTSGGGAIIGAIAGGLIGSQLGGGNSQGIATMAGVVGGAVLGNQVEGQNASTPTTTCTTQTVYENRLIGYNVVYEYAGKQYNVQLPQDPGLTIPLQVTPHVRPALGSAGQPDCDHRIARGLHARPRLPQPPTLLQSYEHRLGMVLRSSSSAWPLALSQALPDRLRPDKASGLKCWVDRPPRASKDALLH
jgi:uncharacterized protein YcfJ